MFIFWKDCVGLRIIGQSFTKVNSFLLLSHALNSPKQTSIILERTSRFVFGIAKVENIFYSAKFFIHKVGPRTDFAILFNRKVTDNQSVKIKTQVRGPS